jgi:hypothetical protein
VLAESERILGTFRSRGLRAGAFLNYGDGIPHGTESAAAALGELFAGGYLVESVAGVELTELGERQTYGEAPNGHCGSCGRPLRPEERYYITDAARAQDVGPDTVVSLICKQCVDERQGSQ